MVRPSGSDGRIIKRRPVRAGGVRTRQKLLAAAEHVFARDGYLAARVADIAATAEVSHGSFYTYFSSKEDIFRQTAEARVEQITDALAATDPNMTTEERVRAANRRYMEIYEEHASFLGVIEQVGTFSEEFRGMRRDIRHRFTDRIETAIRRIAVDAPNLGLDPHVAASALGGMTDDFAYTWFVLKEPFDKETALRTIDEVWLRTLGLSPSIAEDTARSQLRGHLKTA